jgi:hypothetical protein
LSFREPPSERAEVLLRRRSCHRQALQQLTEDGMAGRILIVAISLATAMWASGAGAQVFDLGKYPDLKGQWRTIVPRLPGQNIRFDPSKPWGRGQEAPLTPEYQKVLEESMADQANGGLGNYPTAQCLPGGMPRMMSYNTQEYIVTQDATYILLGNNDPLRRIFTDGRPWPAEIVPSYRGYSIGNWVDEDGDGKYDVLEVETRGPFRGPRAYDATGLPLHFDNMSTFKERFYLDKANPNILHDEITVIDHALTRPWTVDKTFRRDRPQYPNWNESFCEQNAQIKLGKENYFLSGDGRLMPTRKDQPPPDLSFFKQN